MKKGIRKGFILFCLILCLFMSNYKVQAQAPESTWNSLKERYTKLDKVKQLIFVKYQGGSKAQIVVYKKKNGKFQKVFMTPAYVGKNGIGKTKEGDKKTPKGIFKATRAFGIKKNPGSVIKYTQVHKDLYACTDRAYYNQIIDLRKVKHRCYGEHLINYAPNYNYGLVLNYNSKCVYNRGSNIFLHCMGKNKYTMGCIAVSQEAMIKILKMVDQYVRICVY